MAHAERCPVCGGSGEVSIPIDPYSNTTIYPPPTARCHGCGGLGWVVVPDKPKDEEKEKSL